MAIGQRIKYFRNLQGLTQKELGEKLGFSGRTSDVRIAQYESEARIPKEDLVKMLAAIFQISPRAINVPDIDTYDGLMQTLFALEDIYGFQIDKLDNEVCIRLDKYDYQKTGSVADRLESWYTQAERFRKEEITKEEYDRWRYTYPQSEAKRTADSLREAHKKHKAKEAADENNG